MKTLIVIPMRKEMDFFLQACTGLGFKSEPSRIGRLPVAHLPGMDATVACGGLGKTQFAIQTQHLIDAGPGWDLVVCAGAAGALAGGLSAGDVVVATETVEHDIRNRFGKPLMPRFEGAGTAVEALRALSIPGAAFSVRFGPVASGDEDIIDPARRAELHLQTGAIAAAWEGAGGARACSFSGVPYVEIRGITDAADERAATDFEANLEKAMNHAAVLIAAWTGVSF